MTERVRPLVLVVDDHEMSRLFISDTLGPEGFDVVPATSGEEALRSALEHEPDVIVLDVGLPDIDGFEVCRRLKASPFTASMPVLHLSGEYREATDRVRGLDSGADGYLIKPVQPLELTATVKMLLRVRRAEAESETRFRLLVDSVPVLVWALDDKGRVVLFNRACELLTGYRREEVLGRPFLPLLVPDRAAASDGVLGDAPRSHERAWLAKSGAERLVEWDTFRMPGRTGQPMIVGVGRDITERRRGEEALKRSEEQYRALVEGSIQGMYILQGFVIRFANQAIARIFGYDTAAELIGRDARQLLAPGERARIEGYNEARLRGGPTPTRYQFQGMRKGSELCWLEAMVSVVPWERGAAVLVTLFDITEQKRAEEALRTSEDQLRQLQKMEAVGRLAGGVAHDFNNLLTVVSGRCEILMARLRPADPLRRDVDLIHTTAKRAASLTKQLLAFSRKQVLQPRILDLNALVGTLVPMLQRLIGEDVELVTELAPSLAPVKADPGQIEQVIVNLAVNARDAMPAGGRLTIATANARERRRSEHAPTGDDGPHVVLAVRDTGVGMDPETRSRIFEPFFTTKDQGKGTGLGLATVYGIVSQSGGTISVESALGHGTTFEIRLPPVDEAAEELTPPPVGPDLPRGTETVLLVEDENEVRDVVRQILGDLGYTVLEAGQPSEAALIAERHIAPIHLLLTDVVLPQMSGRRLVERLRPMRPEMSVLYMSGYTDDAIERHGVLDPGTVFMQKPFSAETLALKVREALSGSRH